MITVKKRTPKQIAGAGLTLGVGMVTLPFIPFKNASHYKPFLKRQKGVAR